MMNDLSFLGVLFQYCVSKTGQNSQTHSTFYSTISVSKVKQIFSNFVDFKLN